MSPFVKLKSEFEVTWTTLLVGWKGLGGLSAWPNKPASFPTLLSRDEISAFTADKLQSSSNPAEQGLILRMLASDLATESRETVEKWLSELSEENGSDPLIELRKWRLVLLEQLLDNIPGDALYGLIALTEFWQNFGFPPDSPHEVQGRGNAISPSEYYQTDHLKHALSLHRAWIMREKSDIQARAMHKSPAGDGLAHI